MNKKKQFFFKNTDRMIKIAHKFKIQPI